MVDVDLETYGEVSECIICYEKNTMGNVDLAMRGDMEQPQFAYVCQSSRAGALSCLHQVELPRRSRTYIIALSCPHQAELPRRSRTHIIIGYVHSFMSSIPLRDACNRYEPMSDEGQM